MSSVAKFDILLPLSYYFIENRRNYAWEPYSHLRFFLLKLVCDIGTISDEISLM